MQAVFGDARMDHWQFGHLMCHEIRRSRHSGQSRCLWQACLARLAMHGPVIGHHVDPFGWRHGPLVGHVTGLATASPATGPGWRALGRARQVGRRRPAWVTRILPHQAFEIPDAFLRTDDRCPLLDDCRPELSNQCVQAGNHVWHDSANRPTEPNWHRTPMNEYCGTIA